MPFKLENRLQVEKSIRGVCELEQKVGWHLWSYLDQPRHMNVLREYALAALGTMQDVGRVMWVHVTTRVETQLAIYSKMAGSDYRDFVNVIAGGNTTPGDIADVIRVFGAWVEVGAPSHGDYFRKWEEEKKGKQGHLLGDSAEEVHEELLEEKDALRKGPSPKFAAFSSKYRSRGPTRGKHKLWRFQSSEDVRMSPEISEYLRRQQPHAGKKFTYVDGGAPVLQSSDGRASAGRLGKGPVGHSTVGRMERLFGLLDLHERSEGADISGTTADQIFFLKFWARQFNTPVDPALYLLPLATLVTPYHHSLLEVALTLSYNKRITGVSYVIGQYETLVSENSGDRQQIRGNVLLPFTQDANNCRMLVYYSNPWSPEGSWIYEPRMELDRWRRIAKADDPLLYSKCNSIRGSGGWPNELDVQRMML